MRLEDVELVGGGDNFIMVVPICVVLHLLITLLALSLSV